MVTSAIRTFTQKVLWNNLDFLIIDMPPGTGDTQLTFSQEIKIDGAGDNFNSPRNCSFRC
jgi:ATP-binding protein involved in chromosome partitioning